MISGRATMNYAISYFFQREIHFPPQSPQKTSPGKMLYRLITESTNESINDPIKELTDEENRILEIIKSGRRLTRDEMAQEISKSKATVQRCINSLLTKIRLSYH